MKHLELGGDGLTVKLNLGRWLFSKQMIANRDITVISSRRTPMQKQTSTLRNNKTFKFSGHRETEGKCFKWKVSA